MKTTLHERLQANGFDFTSGFILFQETRDPKDDPDDTHSPGWSEPTQPTRVISQDEPVLHREYDSGYGGPECPRFIAKDDTHIYFPYQYDGSTGIVKVRRDFGAYIGTLEPLPYPGG
jgi:hypothetical protein